MPMSAELRRRLATLRTVSRSEANHLNARLRVPYLHAGNERYVSLLDAVRELGAEDTVRLAEDRRSILYWEDYAPTVLVSLHLLIATNAPMLSPDEMAWFTARLQGGPQSHLPAPDGAGADAQLLSDVLRDYAAYVTASAGGQQVPVSSPEDISRTLRLVTMYVAVASLTDTNGSLTPRQLRQNVSGLLTGARHNLKGGPQSMYTVGDDGSVAFEIRLMHY